MINGGTWERYIDAGPAIKTRTGYSIVINGARFMMHASATEVRFSVVSEPDGFVFRLEDNGRGFPERPVELTSSVPAGVGLGSMRERITKLGGTMSYTNRVGGGAVVAFRVALRQRAGLA